MKEIVVTLAAVNIWLLLSAGSIFAAQCPESLVPNDSGNWYVTDPFSGQSQIRFVAVFSNADSDGRALEFGGETFQIWSVPNVVIPPLTINAQPSGIVNLGEYFTYDLTIDVSGLDETEYSLAFRPESITSGTMSPSQTPLVSAVFYCIPSQALSYVDFDGDGKTDIAVYRGNTGTWYVIPSGGGTPYGVGWGIFTDKPVPGDYDGDGKTDYGVYRGSAWFIYPSGGGSAYVLGWGIATDKPVPGDYDGDGKTDCAVYRNGMWFVYPSGGGSAYALGWGIATDKPVPGDYDGDGKTDCAVYRNGMWFVYPSGGGSAYALGWGVAGDKPVRGDYDGDGKTDIAVYRPSTGVWYIIPSGGASPYGMGWGGDPSDVPLSTNPD